MKMIFCVTVFTLLMLPLSLVESSIGMWPNAWIDFVAPDLVYYYNDAVEVMGLGYVRIFRTPLLG